MHFIQQIVHLPEQTLRACSFCCFGGQYGLVMDLIQGQVTINNTNISRICVFQTQKQRGELCAEWSLKIAPFDDRDGGIVRPSYPITGLYLNDFFTRWFSYDLTLAASVKR